MLQTRDWWRYTYYTYDANGQVLATYEVSLNSGFKYAYLKDQNIYGASRLGMRKNYMALYSNAPVPYVIPAVQQNTLGTIAYEITNYLGNVNVVISDRKLWVPASSAFKAVVLSRTDYFPFGMEISSRTTNSDNYRFGYNGMESDNETKGSGNSYTTEFRQYDPRIGRWLSLDPLMAQYPMMSPYVAFNNNPIYFVDPLGLEGECPDEPGEPEKTQDLPEVTVTAKGLPQAEVKSNQAQAILRTGKFKSSEYDSFRSSENAYKLARKMDNLTDFGYLYDKYNWGQYDNAMKYGHGPNASYDGNAAKKAWGNPYDDIKFYGKTVGLGIATAYTGIFVAPYAASTSLTISRYLPGAFSYSSKFWLLKASISAGSQAIINQGDINVVGVIGDGFFGYGTSSLAQSSVNLTVNPFTGKAEFKSIFSSGNNNISIQQFAFESSVGIVFGYKQNFVLKYYNKNFGPGRPTYWRNFGKESFGATLYTLPSNGINKAYENEH